MNTEDHFLVTTADERTWDVSRKILFLGDWCLRYDKKDSWCRLDAEIAAPYGLDVNQKLQDFEFSQSMQNIILPKLVKILNDQHNTNHSLNFWKILLGHWLKYFVDIVMNRHKSLIQVNTQFNIIGSAFIELSKSNFIPHNTFEMISFPKSDSWNSTLDLKIVKTMEEFNFPIKIVNDLELNLNALNGVSQRIARNTASDCLKKFCNLFVRNNEAFIFSSYLPTHQEIKLQLLLGQVPKFWYLHDSQRINAEPDIDLRGKLTQQLLVEFDSVYSKLLFDLLPTCFLEGFVNLNLVVKKSKWPKHPKFIFTSNEFLFNEAFKLYAALAQENGITYFVGQHGNNYGTSRFSVTDIEESTPNYFLTWGWQNQMNSYLPAYIFKTAGVKAKHDKNGDLLLLEYHYQDRLSIWDTDREHLTYFEDLILFIDMLDEGPREYLNVRLHHESSTDRFNSGQRLNELLPKVRTEYWEVPILEQFNKTRLAIFSYDSTGMLESLALNIPTMAFWQNGLDHLNDSAKSYYQILVDAGIVHLSAKSIARKVNEVWTDVDSWWSQDSIQLARKVFCDQYARTSKRPIRDLRDLFKENFNDKN
jgi:putative transferase (TIGR04331 family)